MGEELIFFLMEKLGVFFQTDKARQDGALSNQVKWKVSLPVEEWLEQDDL